MDVPGNVTTSMTFWETYKEIITKVDSGNFFASGDFVSHIIFLLSSESKSFMRLFKFTFLAIKSVRKLNLIQWNERIYVGLPPRSYQSNYLLRCKRKVPFIIFNRISTKKRNMSFVGLYASSSLGSHGAHHFLLFYVGKAAPSETSPNLQRKIASLVPQIRFFEDKFP